MTNPYAWLGYRRDARDDRDYRFRAPRVQLPAKVDLRDDMPAVLNQGTLGSCVLNATTVALRYCLQRAGRRAPKLSRLQGYYDVRKAQDTLREDSGCEIRIAIKCASKIGIGRETLWPYKIGSFKQRPPGDVYADAVNFNAMQYRRVAVRAHDVKAAVAAGFPVIIGVTLYQSFDSKSVESTGMVPMPNMDMEPAIGGHAMLVVGYGQRKGRFTVRNSWSRSWGDNGDCYIPEDYIGSPEFGGDYWIVSLVG